MIRSTGKRVILSLSLAVAIAAIGFGSCSYFESRDGGAPFLLYRVDLVDAGLDVVHVHGAMFGVTADAVPLRAFAGPRGAVLDPIGFTAVDDRGRPLSVRVENGVRTVKSGRRDFTIEYDVALGIGDRYSSDVRDMMTSIGSDRCRMLGRDVFFVPEVRIADGVLVDVRMFPGGSLSSSSPCNGGRIIVSDCEELPFTLAACGEYRRLDRVVSGTDIALAIADSWSFTDAELFDVVCRIVAEEISLFGSSPRQRYLFVCDGNPVRGGERFDYYGIHYGGNMILLLDPRIDRSELVDTPMAIIAHEFFHNWNGELLAPDGPEFLWFTEGVTNYYSYRVLRDVRVITDAQYATRRRAIAERYRENPYARTVPIGAAANNDMRDKDMVNLLYDGGFLAAEALDVRLRADTDGAVALIDVLKHMCGRGGGGGAADESTFVRAAAELGGGALSAFLDSLVHAPCPERLASGSSPLE